MRIAMVAGLAAALLACGCSKPESVPELDPKAVMTGILDALASPTAERVGDIGWYDATTLHNYNLNGDDTNYLKCGFERLAHSEWRSPGAKGEGHVDVDLYDLGTPEGALDRFSHPRAQWQEFLDIGNEAQRTDGGIEVRIGRYFVRVIARQEVSAQRSLVESLARAVAAATPPGPSDTQLMAPLPPTGMHPHTDTFCSKGYLGRPFIEKVREASYDVAGNQSIRMFVIDAATPEAAQKLYDEWKTTVPTPPIGAGAAVDRLEWDEPLLGRVVVVKKGRWLAGTIGDPAISKTLFNSFLQRLQ
jgi:hypothetical protein